MSEHHGPIGPVRTFALAAGGMAGGGIYIALAVVIESAGQWAWASFLLSGLAAIITALSYSELTSRIDEAGGAFDFVEHMNRENWAGNLAWLLLIGYTLTISVYAFAFGNYVSDAFGGNPVITRILIVAIVAAMIGLNLAGAGKLTSVEVVIVTSNLAILTAIALYGVIFHWNTDSLSQGIASYAPASVLTGAATIFVAYEGFQLLTYDYDDMNKPAKWFARVLTSAAASVVIIYVLVTLGFTMMSGAGFIVENKGTSLAAVASQQFGLAGTIVMTLAAAFATTAAINSTLYSTAKLSALVARDGELPSVLAKQNRNGVPSRAIILIATAAGCLALLGSLSSLVEAASLVFVFTFGTVNAIAFRDCARIRLIAGAGVLLCAAIGVALCWHLANQKPFMLAAILAVTVAVVALRRRILAFFGTTDNANHA